MLSRPKIKSMLFAIIFIIANIRGILSYIFSFGDPNSSPHYDEWPKWYFTIWMLLMAGIVTIIIKNTKKINIKKFTILLLAAFPIIHSIATSDSFYVAGMSRGILLYGLIILLLSSNSGWIKIKYILNSIKYIALVGVLFLAFQILAYLIFDSLPAHSHQGIIVRFGSVYNDSLVFGIMIPMFMGFFLTDRRSSPQKQIAIIFVSLASAILTGGIVAMSTSALYLLWVYRYSFFKIIVSAFTLAAAILINWEQINLLFLVKSRSIEDHLSSLDVLNRLDLLTLSGLRPMDIFTESGYVNLIINYGFLVFLIIFIVNFQILRISSSLRKSSGSDFEIKKLAGAVEGLSFSLLLANITHSPIVYPPVYLTASILFGIFIYAYRLTLGKSKLTVHPA
jgi:hypothetical protein